MSNKKTVVTKDLIASRDKDEQYLGAFIRVLATDEDKDAAMFNLIDFRDGLILNNKDLSTTINKLEKQRRCQEKAITCIDGELFNFKVLGSENITLKENS